MVQNAIDSTFTGGVNIIVSYKKETQKVLFRIDDTGIGIKPEEQSKIFQLIKPNEKGKDAVLS